VDVDNLLVSQPDYAEQALEITSALVSSGSVDVLVIDSVAALVPKAELDGEMGEAFVGIQARLMSQALRKLAGIVSKSNTCLIFINQIREKIGVMFGNPETTSGGRALKFYATVRADIRRIAAIKEGDVVTGNRTKVKIVKNKVAAPFREAEFDILYGQGISREGDLIDLGVQHNAIEKSGSWFSHKGERIGQGRENARQFLKDNPDIAGKLEAELRRILGLERPAPAAGEAAPVEASPKPSPAPAQRSR
jgi:recombination protein RecA